MEHHMRILVVGAGATGGFFGARLAQAGRDVTFLVRPKRAALLRETGLRVVSPHGDFEIEPVMVTAEDIGEPYDVVLMTVKAFGLEAAMQDVAPAVGSQTMILPVLNGMRHIDMLRERFGDEAVIGGAARIMSAMDAEWRIVQFSKMNDIVYGELSGGKTARIVALDGVMQGAGFEARLSETIELEMWEKWVLLASLGSINSLMRGTIGQVRAAPGGEEFALGVIGECAAVAAAHGFAPRAGFLAAANTQLTMADAGTTSSMYRDLVAGQQIEADQIVGDLAARGKAAGVAVPLLNAAYANLCVYQAGLA
jgi:2-dehydropantoate 2-reductase